MALRSARSWAVWSVGLAAYVVAVLHRTSLGAAGLDAQARFDVGAGALASFAVLQLLVYAGLQVPFGVLLDRFGSLRLIGAGALLMAAGLILEARTGGTADYGLNDFKIALAVQYLVGLFGLAGILRTRRLARRKLAEDGIVVRPIREILAERRGLVPSLSVKGSAAEEGQSGQQTIVKQRRT